MPELWIANLPERRIEVYREPEGDEYRAAGSVSAEAGEAVAPVAFPELAVSVAELFGYL